jgi:hypothetical protein
MTSSSCSIRSATHSTSSRGSRICRLEPFFRAGKLEVTFVVDAAYLVEAQKVALSAFNEANVVTAAWLANRIGGPLNLEWTSSHTDLTDLVTA